jgi:hypothetical protein
MPSLKEADPLNIIPRLRVTSAHPLMKEADISRLSRDPVYRKML